MKKIFVLVITFFVIGLATVLAQGVQEPSKGKSKGSGKTPAPTATTQTAPVQNSVGNTAIILEDDETRMAEMKRRFRAIRCLSFNLENGGILPEAAVYPNGMFSQAPSVSPPYRAGQAKPEVLQTALDALNFLRYIAGLNSDVVLDDELTDLMQHGAVLLTKVNQLTHYPAKPADMDQNFFNKGYKATSSSSISGYYMPDQGMFSLADDNSRSNLEHVGHRRVALNRGMTKAGFGVGVGRFFLQKEVVSENTIKDYDYMAWPKQGYFPSMLATGIWSLSVNESQYGRPDINKVKITMLNTNTGRECIMSKSNLTQWAYFNINYSAYGRYDNVITFSPAFGDYDLYYLPGNEFQITVTGLKEDIKYMVKLFDIMKE